MVVVGGFFLIVLGLFAAGAKPAPGQNPERVIKVHLLGDFSGPYVRVSKWTSAGIMDYFRWLNEEKGGINGIRVETVWADHGSNVERALAQYERLKAGGMYIMWGNHTSVAVALKDKLIRDGIVSYEEGGDESLLFPPGNTFMQGPFYPEAFGAVLQWIKANWKEKRAPRIGYLTTDNPMGRAHIALGTPYAKKLGFEFVGTEFCTFTPMDVTPQVMKLRNAGADYIYGNVNNNTVGPIMKTLRTLGLQDKMYMISTYWNIPEAVLEVNPPEVLEGQIMPYPVPTLDETAIPGIKNASEFSNKYRATKLESSYMWGWGNAEHMHEAIRLALEAVGYEKLNGKNIRDFGFAKMKNFKGSGVFGEVTFSDVERRGAQAVRILQCRNGKYVRVSDWIKVPHLVPEEYKYLFPDEFPQAKKPTK
jgi:ABC-type branched-subunit amino acid transport system substrate-binding protein